MLEVKVMGELHPRIRNLVGGGSLTLRLRFFRILGDANGLVVQVVRAK
jgi:hypothetical protein